MNAIAWYMVFIGYLGADVQPAYSLILDGAPIATESACKDNAKTQHAAWEKSQRKEYPNLEAYWFCAASKGSLSLTQANSGWHTIWAGYAGDDQYPSLAIITPNRYVSETTCNWADTPSPQSDVRLTWEPLCAEPLTGQM